LPQGVNVIDPYCGSGTTGIACVNNNIDFIGIDIVPEYAKLAEERIREVEINDTNIL